MDEAQEVPAVEGAVFPASVTGIEEQQVVVKFGEHEGLVPLSDFHVPGAEPQVAVGDAFDVYVDQKSTECDRFLVSKDKAVRLKQFEDAVDAFEKKETIEGEIVSEVEGGFSVDIGVKAFLPSSQFAMRPVRDAEQVIGQRFKFRIVKFNKKRHNIVLSRRVLLEDERDRVIDRIKVGAIIEGTVKNFVEYGAFVDVGGIDGLLHISDMSWSRVSHPSEILRVGEPITVKVLKFDRKKQRLSLGLRQIQEDPWLEAEKNYPTGKEVSGTVVSKTDYGCFIELEAGIEGLVHSTGKFVEPGAGVRLKKVEIGQELTAVVLDTDIKNKRISLGLKDK